MEKDDEIYQNDQPYPLEFYTNMNCYTMKGYRTLILQLHPIRYHPVQNTIEYYPIINITITVHHEERNSHVRSSIEDKVIIKNKVDNPDMIEKYQKDSPMIYDSPTFAILLSRYDKDIHVFPDAEIIYIVERDGAIFTVVKDLTNDAHRNP